MIRYLLRIVDQITTPFKTFDSISEPILQLLSSAETAEWEVLDSIVQELVRDVLLYSRSGYDEERPAWQSIISACIS